MDHITVATAGLFWAWLANDVEELATYRRSVATMNERFPAWVPRRPVPDQTQVNVGIATVGVLIASAAVRGVRTGGRSQYFQDSLWAFGMHGFVHLGMSALARGYTTGVATAPTVVIPFWLWARHTLEQAGVPQRPRRLVGTAMFVGALIGCHRLGRAVSDVAHQP